jgi:hypothetical protein
MDMDKTGYIQYFNESEALTIPLDVWNDSNQAREGYLSMTFETGHHYLINVHFHF